MKGKRTKREQVKFPAFEKRYNSRIRQEYMDLDYIDKLNDDEKKWLHKFMEEFNNASLILDENGDIDPTKNIHQTAAHKKDIYDMNNAKNRCLYGNLKNKGDKFNNTKLINYDNVINDVEEHLSKERDPKSLENAYVDFLDNEHVNEMLVEYDLAMKNFSGSLETQE